LPRIFWINKSKYQDRMLNMMIVAFVGKGGVGKTTIASAVALSLAKEGKVALVSSDFMPSLKYLFREVQENLEVIEITESEMAKKWKARYGSEVFVILNNLFDVDEWIIDHIASSPGVAEEFLISGITDLDMSMKYDYVVWDTAASSSTMHLILLQKEFYDHLSRDVKIYLKLRDVIHSDKILDILEQWKELAQRVWRQLLDSKFFLVTNGDELSIVQAGEINEDLYKMGIKVSGLICNRSPGKCNNNAIISIPEFTGSAREIVDKISRTITENKEVLSVLRSRNEQKVL
ncbi:MAG: ArsA-related P-loop ATPase, partial [Thermoplasmatales archaeon]